MPNDRFKNYDADVRDLVLSFEHQRDTHTGFFDVEQLEVIADFYLEHYDVAGLQAAVEYGEQLFPTSPEIKLRRANLWSIQGEYPKAIARLKELEAANPGDVDIYYSLATTYSLADQALLAIQYYQKVVAAEDAYDLDLLYGSIADEYYKLGQPDEAIRYYRKSLDVWSVDKPSSNYGTMVHNLYNLACTWDEQGRHDEAVDYFSTLTRKQPYNAGAWYCLGCLYNWMSLYEKSIDAYEYAIAIDKTLVDAYYGLSESSRALGNFSRAVQALHEALEVSTDRPYVLYSIGSLYLEQGNRHTASVYLHDAVKEDPAYSEAWNELGRCSLQMGYPEEAAAYYRRAIDLDPDKDEHWISLADLYMGSDRYSEAAALIESARSDAHNLIAFDSRLLYCYFRLGRRSRLFALLHQDASIFSLLYPMLLNQYPDMVADPEILNAIKSLTA